MKERWRMPVPLLVGTGLVLGGFPAVYGQDVEQKTAEEKDDFNIEVIVVTAERRAEVAAAPLEISTMFR